eukprot:COSAG06_NODE_51633_length_311_cov_0.330189_1_plen_97_part_10
MPRIGRASSQDQSIMVAPPPLIPHVPDSVMCDHVLSSSSYENAGERLSLVPRRQFWYDALAASSSFVQVTATFDGENVCISVLHATASAEQTNEASE